MTEHDPRDVVLAVSKYFEVSQRDILGTRRHRKISVPRQVAYTLCRFLCQMSFEAIGKLFGRDHTTIQYGVKKTLARNDRSPKHRRSYSRTYWDVVRRTEAKQGAI